MTHSLSAYIGTCMQRRLDFMKKTGLSGLWGNVLRNFFTRMDHVCHLVKAPLALLNSTHRLKSELWLLGWTSPLQYAKFESIRYFIDIDILQNCLIDIDIDIDIFQNHHIDIDIDIDIFGIALSISIFSKMTILILISISIFFKSVDISTIDMSYRYIEQGYSNQWSPSI